MSKTYLKFFGYLIIFFLISKTSCLLETISNFFKDIKKLREIVNNRTFDNRTIKSKNNSRIYQPNKSKEIYNIFYRMLKNTKRQIKTTFKYIYNDFVHSIESPNTKNHEKIEPYSFYNYKNEKKQNKKNQFFVRKKQNEDSIFEKIIISDIMLIYSLAEIFLSLSIVFIIIPTILILRKWIKSIRKKNIKEVNMLYSEFKTIYHKNSLEEDDCSICLEKILIGNISISSEMKNNNLDTCVGDNCQFKNKQNISLSHLDCGHLYHSNCLKEWIDRSKITCPFCRKEIETITYVD